MTDKEKVVKSLETCSDVYYGATGACSSCSFSQSKNCFAELVYQTIELLKEQEVVEPTINEYGEIFCGNCGENVGIIGQTIKTVVRMRYCRECGRMVKWK